MGGCSDCPHLPAEHLARAGITPRAACCMAEVFERRGELLTLLKTAAVGPTELLAGELMRFVGLDVSSDMPPLALEVPVEEPLAVGGGNRHQRRAALAKRPHAHGRKSLVSRP